MHPGYFTTPNALSTAGVTQLVFAVAACWSCCAWADPAVQFNRDIRPILSENCYPCHGPDKNKRKSELRLDSKQGAFADLGGYQAIVPGRPDESEMIRRILAKDVDERMPPPDSDKRLSPPQVAMIRQWVGQGAEFPDHWAFVPPRRPAVPKATSGMPTNNAIDNFVVRQLENEGLTPAPEADRQTLIRRVSFDLIGLPPTIEEVHAFVNDTRKDAYERLVDRLLGSPHYGERMAQNWLDNARYADTTGYAADTPRTMWLYRDWVINAFNRNMPFDQFTIEQLAGDMLPSATVAQKIATGFHRNSMQALGNNPRKEEFRIKGIVDRLDTTGRVWLGLTLACAECHDHKFDPISQREYYQLFAIFNNIPHHGQAFDVHGPRLQVTPPDLPVPDDAPKKLAAARAEQQGTIDASGSTSHATTALHQATMPIQQSGPVTAQVMEEMPTPRQTYVHFRGNFENKGECVDPAVPHFLGSLPSDTAANRLSFARWLVDGNNPLVARTIVNRMWQHFFGTGIVRTVEDFGSQGEWPSHPELLDWLAVEFVESGWDVKHINILIVMSATYRQTAIVGPELLKKDFHNRLLARGPRHRLAAEQIRDNLLAVSGLLNRKVGGPSVCPVQPSHVGEFRDQTAGKWLTSQGTDRYRRGLYTFWQRMYPYPSLTIFDAPSREVSCVRRSRSNTPLQALVTLNDPVFFEAAQAFGRRIVDDEKAQSPAERMTFAFEAALARRPSADELQWFQAFFQQQQEQFRDDLEAAALVAQGRPAPHADLAAWTMVASTLLNLDETISKQ